MNLKNKKKNEEGIWYQLDLSAVVYPTLQRRNFSSVYRLSAVMKEDVNPELLQQALDQVLVRFPSYKVAMRKGFFWRYLEPNNRPGPFVKEDIKNPCQPMGFKTNNRYLIRVYYYGKRVALEAHHCLGDGNGGMALFTTILAQYLRLQGHKIDNGYTVMDINESPDPEETEDAYMKYANALVQPARPKEDAYLIRGTREPFYTLNMIVGVIDAKEILAVSKKYEASVTEYINACLLYSLLEKQRNDLDINEETDINRRLSKKLRPVALAMPVNLRRFFPSKTLRNFISMVYPCVDPRLGEYSFEDIIKQVHHYMRYYINDKFLRGDITTNASTKRHPLIRVVPLAIKDIVVRHFYKSVQDVSSTAGITNMGVLKLPENMREYIDRFSICMGQPYSNKTNCSVITYENVMTITFASSIKEADVERIFFNKLVRDGIHVLIETNRN